MDTVELIIDGKLEVCEVSIARNGDFVCEAANGRFIKFPDDGTDLSVQVEEYNERHADIKYTLPEIQEKVEDSKDEE